LPQINPEKICQKPRKKLAFRCLAILNANNAIAIYARECAGTYTNTVRMCVCKYTPLYV